MKPLECSRLNAQNRVQAGEEDLVVNSVKSSRKIQQKKKVQVQAVSRGWRWDPEQFLIDLADQWFQPK